MAISWTPKTTPDLPSEGELAQAFGALGHPARIHLLRILLERGETSAGELAGRLPLSQATVSQHLARLHRAGLVTRRAEGLHRYYALDRARIQDLRRRLRAF